MTVAEGSILPQCGKSLKVSNETRILALGMTAAGRLLTAAFTVRGKGIRIISVRDMSRKERRAYDQAR